MAGKFLLIEEAARQLGVTADEIHRLVERKQLFPLRDGATLKFKVEEIERLVADAGEKSGQSGLELELDLDDGTQKDIPLAAAEGESRDQTIDLELGDSVVVGGSPLPGTAGKSDSLVIGGSGSLAGSSAGDVSMGTGITGGESVFAVDPPGQNELAKAMLGSSDAISGLDAMELDLDSIVGLSSPALGSPADGAAAGPADSGTIAIDLSGVGGGSQPSNASGLNASGSLVFGSDLNPASGSGPHTNAGSALSGALDSGLSLEDGDAAVSGIDLGPLDTGLAGGSMASGSLAAGSATDLAGEEFDLGGLDEDDESASVVAVEPGSGDSGAGDSSFFGDTAGESSDFTGDLPMSTDLLPDIGGGVAVDMVRDTKFSTWQICGLVCCSLLLLTGGFVMFDLMRTIGSPNDLALSGPLLTPLSSVFGWR